MANPAVEQGAEDRLHDRAAQIALQIGRSGRHAGSPDRHRTGQGVRRRRARQADADADEHVAERDLPVGNPALPEDQHRQEAEQAEEVAQQERESRAPRVDQFRRTRRDDHHADGGRQDRRARVEGRVFEHVLQELLADEHRAHQAAEHDDPRHCGDPEDPPRRHREVIQRELGSPLAQEEPGDGGERDGAEAQRHRSLIGDGREVDRQHQRRDAKDGQDPAEVVDGVRRLVDVARNEHDCEDQRDDGERQSEQEHRAPRVVLEQGPRRQRP